MLDRVTFVGWRPMFFLRVALVALLCMKLVFIKTVPDCSSLYLAEVHFVSFAALGKIYTLYYNLLVSINLIIRFMSNVCRQSISHAILLGFIFNVFVLFMHAYALRRLKHENRGHFLKIGNMNSTLAWIIKLIITFLANNFS